MKKRRRKNIFSSFIRPSRALFAIFARERTVFALAQTAIVHISLRTAKIAKINVFAESLEKSACSWH